LQRKLLKQVKELDDVMKKHPEIVFRLQVKLVNNFVSGLKNFFIKQL